MKNTENIQIKFLNTPSKNFFIQILLCIVLSNIPSFIYPQYDSTTFAPNPSIGFQHNFYAKAGAEHIDPYLVYVGVGSFILIYGTYGQLYGVINTINDAGIYDMAFSNQFGTDLYVATAGSQGLQDDSLTIIDRDGNHIITWSLPSSNLIPWISIAIGKSAIYSSSVYSCCPNRIYTWTYSGQLDTTSTPFNLPYIEKMDLKEPCTMLTVNHGSIIARYDICEDTVISNFANLEGYQLYDIAYISTGTFAGQVLVTTQSTILRVNALGIIARIYDVGGENGWTHLYLDPDDTTFWSSSISNFNNIYRINLVTGAVVTAFTVPYGIQAFAVSGFDFLANTTTNVLNLIALMEGYYNSEPNLLIEDTVIVYLRNASSPNSIVHVSKSVLDNNGSGTFNFYNAKNGIPYYIGVKHRNSIETWSSETITFTEGIPSNYDFTSSLSQALGNNLVSKGKKWCIFSGDANQDGTIDATDVGLIKNDANNSITGYVSTDLNGDGIVNEIDVSICEKNALNFVIAMTNPQVEKAKREMKNNTSTRTNDKKDETLREKK